jgi:tripeptide aminopeptidase
MPPFDFDEEGAIGRLLRFLAVEGVTGHERAIGEAVAADLVAGGVACSAIHFDEVHHQIPLPTETGNLIVRLPGTRPGTPRLFMTHLDTVPLCAGAQPVRKGNRIVAAGETALGGDNRTGVAVLATTATTLIQRGLAHPPLTFLFTVREESGLWGARFVDQEELGEPEECFNFDGRLASELTVGAVGADRWEVEIAGRAAHAGVHPERGVSATAAAALAIADVYKNGWFGKVQQGKRTGTSNVGPFGGQDGKAAGAATNVVTDYVHIRGESRSHDLRFVTAITAAYKAAFKKAAGQVRDDRGRSAKVRFNTRREYFPYHLKPTAPVVRHAQAAAESAGLKPTLRLSNGGLDANWLVRNGVPTVSFGAGQNNIHSIGEYVDLGEFRAACKLALALATAD